MAAKHVLEGGTDECNYEICKMTAKHVLKGSTHVEHKLCGVHHFQINYMEKPITSS